MRVGIIALLQESNTFLAGRTTLEHFRQDLLLEGQAVRERLAPAPHEVGGFFAGLEAEGIEAVPLFAARAIPYAAMTGETLAALRERMQAALEAAGPLDGVLVAPHGATVCESEPDVDGCWLSDVRAHLGHGKPIVGTLDPHANLSPQMVTATDALIAYRTNPHIDQKERGLEAALLMAATLRGDVRPRQAACFPPLAINIEKQHTTEPPLSDYLARLEEVRGRPGVLSCSLLLGFPYADVPEMGSAVVVVADDDEALADRTAAELGEALWDARLDLRGTFLSIDEALDKAAKLGGSVCLLDMGDNAGGGSPADGTLLAAALHRRRMRPAFVCLYDPEAVGHARIAGVGQCLRLQVGGKSDELHGGPLAADFTVIGLHNGRFEEREARHGGFTHYDQGPTAVVATDDELTVMLTSRRMAPFSLQQLIGCGVDPARYRYLVAKGVNAPVAAYEPVCDHFIRVNTPGVTAADMTQLEYRRRRRPMFPFEPDMQWQPGRRAPEAF